MSVSLLNHTYSPSNTSTVILDMSLSVGSTLKLSSGKSIPHYGFGSPPKDKTYESMLTALRLGVRHSRSFAITHLGRLINLLVDTAQMYTNEPEAARAVRDFLKESSVHRSEVFITTKWNPPAGLAEPGVPTQQVYQELQASRKIFVEDNGLEYVDLMLVHQSRPGPEGRASHWRALVKAQQDGWIKEIGVSNQYVPFPYLTCHYRLAESACEIACTQLPC